MTNSADPDQLASSGSTLFAKTGHVVLSKRRVNKANSSDTEVPVLDLKLSVSKETICMKFQSFFFWEK